MVNAVDTVFIANTFKNSTQSSYIVMVKLNHEIKSKALLTLESTLGLSIQILSIPERETATTTSSK